MNLPGTKESFLDYYEQAKSLVAEGRLLAARETVQDCLELNPKFYDAYHLLGQILEKLGENEEALQVFRHLDKVVVFDPELKIMLARLELGRNKPGRARRYLKKLLRRYPRHPEAHFLMGEIYRKRGKNQQASSWYSNCLEIDPGHAAARRGMDQLLQESIQKDASARNGGSTSFLEDIAQPVEFSVEEELAAAAKDIEQGMPDSAMSRLLELTRRYPDHQMVALTLATLLHEEGNTEGAIEKLEYLVEQGNGSAILHYRLGGYYNHLNEPEKAVSHLEAALEEDPDYFEALFELGVVHHRAKRFDQAEDCYQRAIELFPHDERPQVNLAHLYLKKKEKDKAGDVLQRVLEQTPECGEARQLLINLLLQKNDLEGAEEHSRILIKNHPRDASAAVRRSQVLQRKGDLPGAVTEMKRASRLKPGDGTITAAIKRLELHLDEGPGPGKDHVFT